MEFKDVAEPVEKITREGSFSYVSILLPFNVTLSFVGNETSVDIKYIDDNNLKGSAKALERVKQYVGTTTLLIHLSLPWPANQQPSRPLLCLYYRL